MKGTLAFDVYGTLIDPMGIVRALEDLVGEDAADFATAWRSKQFEYLFRRGLGRRFRPFSVCTREALDFTCLARSTDIDAADRDRLLAGWQHLPAFAECRDALTELGALGWKRYAFSNGEAAELGSLLENADLSSVLDGIVSADDVRTFKPDPDFYAHFVEATGAAPGRTWLVSGNPFDVLGSLEVGWKAAWVRRSPGQVFDPWGVEPTAVISSIRELADILD